MNIKPSVRMNLKSSLSALLFIQFSVHSVISMAAEPPGTKIKQEQPLMVEHLNVVGRYHRNQFLLEADDLKAAGIQDTLTAIRLIPGLNIVQNGGVGQTASLNYRGFFQNQILVLLDDVPLNSAFSGVIDWSAIALEDLERIEFSASGSAIEYGGFAMGGVLRLTSSTFADQSGGRLSLSTGSHATRSIGIAAGTHQTGLGSVSLHAQHRATAGTDARISQSPLHDDRDGHEANQARIQLKLPINDRLELAMHSKSYRTQTEYDATSTTSDRFYTLTQGEQYQARLQHRWNAPVDTDFSALSGTTALQISQREHKDDTHAEQQRYQYRFRTQEVILNERLDWQQDYQIHIGFDHSERKALEASSQMPKMRTDRQGQYIKAIIHPEADPQQLSQALGTELGLRWDQDSEFGDQSSYLGALSLVITPEQRLRFSQESGYRTPTFNELYYPNYGNPDLKPEQVTKDQIAWDITWDQTQGQLRAFQNHIREGISKSSPPKNIGRAETAGIEATIQHQKQQLWWRLSAQFQDSQDQNKQPLIAMPHRQYQWDMHWADQWQKYHYRTGQSTRWISEQIGTDPDSFQQQRVAAYTSTDIFFNIEYLEHQVSVRINNLFDRQYASQIKYPALGRVWMLSYRLNTFQP
jgi:vitamin B12 transporter